LVWDDSYAIAQQLRKKYPHIELDEVSLDMIYHWTINLPEFIDDHELANDTILTAIIQEWLEETHDYERNEKREPSID